MQYLEGILKIANLFLAVVAAIVAITLFKGSNKRKDSKPWKLLVVALVFFTIQMVLGALRAFKIYESAYLTHIIPTIILVLLIIAIMSQIHLSKGK